MPVLTLSYILNVSDLVYVRHFVQQQAGSFRLPAKPEFQDLWQAVIEDCKREFADLSKNVPSKIP